MKQLKACILQTGSPGIVGAIDGTHIAIGLVITEKPISIAKRSIV